MGRILGFKPLGKIDIEEEETPNNDKSLFKTVENANEMASKMKNFSDEKLANAIFDIQKTLGKMYGRFESDEIQEEKEIKWKYAALVMDRFFLILTILYFVVTFCAIVMSIPNFYRPV